MAAPVTATSVWSSPLHVFVPGALNQQTGGYLYDARMVRGLRALGWRVEVHELPGNYPQPVSTDLEQFANALAALSDGSLVLIDGLAGGAQPDLLLAHAERLRLIALVHHPLGDETGLPAEARDERLSQEVRGLRGMTGVIVTSNFTAERLSALGVPRVRIRVVIPGTEFGTGPGQWNAGLSSKPSEADEGHSGPCLLCVGTLTPRKGQDLLIEALAGLRELPWQALIVSSPTRDPDFATRVKQLGDQSGLKHRIQWIGEISSDQLSALYFSADLFVLPSWYEGYGMALTEALWHGLPVISTTGGAIPETVPAGAGRLVPPGDVAALGAALADFLASEELRQQASDAALTHAASLPDWITQSRRFAEALVSLAAHPSKEQ